MQGEIETSIEALGRGLVQDASCEIDGVRFAGRLCGRLFLGARADADGIPLELAEEATWREVTLPTLVLDRSAFGRCATCRGGGMVSCTCATCDHTHDAVCTDCDGTGRSAIRDVDESPDDQTVWVEARDPFFAYAVNARLIASAVRWARPERVHKFPRRGPPASAGGGMRRLLTRTKYVQVFYCHSRLPDMVDTRYRTSAGTVFTLKYHFVWCPKYRRMVLVDDVASRLRELLHEKATELGAGILALEIMPDHVHLFVESDPTLAPSHLAAQFKGFTSRVLREEFASLRSRLPTLWSRSYYVGSVGHVSEKTVRNYIESQKRH